LEKDLQDGEEIRHDLDDQADDHNDPQTPPVLCEASVQEEDHACSRPHRRRDGQGLRYKIVLHCSVFLKGREIEEVSSKAPFPATEDQHSLPESGIGLILNSPLPDHRHVSKVEGVPQSKEDIFQTPYSFGLRDIREQPCYPSLDTESEQQNEENEASQYPASNENTCP
jgi:hypothetical protein